MNTNLNFIKKRAKLLKSKMAIKQYEALDQASQEYGCSNWRHAQKKYAYNQNAPYVLEKGTIVHFEGGGDGIVTSSEENGAITLYMHCGANNLLAREELEVYEDQSLSKYFMPYRLFIPYGLWTCDDGTQVLFNRDYKPIWIKDVQGNVSKICPDTWIRFVHQEWFFNDSHMFDKNPKVIFECKAFLRSWGINDGDFPLTCEQFKKTISTGNW